jgi:hypothetical protein
VRQDALVGHDGVLCCKILVWQTLDSEGSRLISLPNATEPCLSPMSDVEDARPLPPAASERKRQQQQHKGVLPNKLPMQACPTPLSAMTLRLSPELQAALEAATSDGEPGPNIELSFPHPTLLHMYVNGECFEIR